jgi:hypothetical protein
MSLHINVPSNEDLRAGVKIWVTGTLSPSGCLLKHYILLNVEVSQR